MASIRTNRGIGRARKARAALGLPLEAPLSDIVATLEAVDDVHVAVLDLPDRIAGAYLRRPGCALLVVNGSQPTARQRFTVAHEFGHHWLGHASVVDAQSALVDYGHDPHEVEANAFAAELLVPRRAIEHRYAGVRRPQVTLEDVVQTAATFGVSAQMLRIRLETGGVLADPGLRKRLDEEIAADLHLEVAERLGIADLDDTIAAAVGSLPRIAPALRDSALGLHLAGALTVEELAERLRRDTSAVRRMLSRLGLDELAPV